MDNILKEIDGCLKRIIVLLCRDEGINSNNSNIDELSFEQKLKLYRELVFRRSDKPLSSDYLSLQDKILGFIRKKKKAIDVEGLDFDSNIAIIVENVTFLKCDCLVNFEKTGKALDETYKDIIFEGGLQIKQDYKYQVSKYIENNQNGNFAVTSGYNLLAKNIMHYELKRASSTVSYTQKIELSNAFKKCLDEARIKKYSNIVFRPLGEEFAYPRLLFVKIAMQTIMKWLKETKSSMKIVFCVKDEKTKTMFKDFLNSDY